MSYAAESVAYVFSEPQNKAMKSRFAQTDVMANAKNGGANIRSGELNPSNITLNPLRPYCELLRLGSFAGFLAVTPILGKAVGTSQ